MVERRLELQAEYLDRFPRRSLVAEGRRCNRSVWEERHRGVYVYLRANECCSNGGCSEPLAIKDSSSSPPTPIAPLSPN